MNDLKGKISSNISLMQFIIYIGILILTIGMLYAKIDLKVGELEKSELSSREDHHNIIALNTKINYMNENLQEIKSDIKDIKSHYERKVASNNRPTDIQN